MPDELTLADMIDFLSDHEGREVYVEIGTRDRESTEQPADSFLLKLHGHRLGSIQDAIDHNPGGERRAPMVALESLDAEGDGAGSRMFLNPHQVTAIQGDPGRGLKVWLDNAVYVGIIPS